MPITRNRYGKHMRELLAIVAQHPGVWYTISRDKTIVQAANNLAKKGIVERSDDNLQIRYVAGTALPQLDEDKPDGWILASLWREKPEYFVTFNEDRMRETIEAGKWAARPFKFIGE